MIQEANAMGSEEIKGNYYNKVQILSIKDILVNKKIFNLPNVISHKNKSNQGKFYL